MATLAEVEAAGLVTTAPSQHPSALGPTVLDVDIRADMSLNAIPSKPEVTHGWVFLRGVETGFPFYFVEIVYNPKIQQLQTQIIPGQPHPPPLKSTGLRLLPGTFYTLRTVVTTDPGVSTRLQTKLWPANAAEPESWDHDVTDIRPAWAVEGPVGFLASTSPKAPPGPWVHGIRNVVIA